MRGTPHGGVVPHIAITHWNGDYCRNGRGGFRRGMWSAVHSQERNMVASLYARFVENHRCVSPRILPFEWTKDIIRAKLENYDIRS